MTTPAGLVMFLAALATAQTASPSPPSRPNQPATPAQAPDATSNAPAQAGSSALPAADAIKPDPEWKRLGDALWFDPQSKKLIVEARVVLRVGPLEHLLCLRRTKEHEAILATPAAPKQIHAGLLLTGAEPGHPVRFLPKFEPPSGTAVAIELRWRDKAGAHTADARSWIKDDRAKPEHILKADWVFVGSMLYIDPITKLTVYAAEEGDLITVANFANAILDLPFASSASDAERGFEAFTDHIPPQGTVVFMLMSPRGKPKHAPAAPRSAPPSAGGRSNPATDTRK